MFFDETGQLAAQFVDVCGGIVGMGENRRQRAALIAQLANLPTPPESVPINNLVQVPGSRSRTPASTSCSPTRAPAKR